MSKEESSNFIKALEQGDRELMKKVPRADIHNHAALGGDFDRWIKKEGLDLIHRGHHYPDFKEFQDFVDQIFTYPYPYPNPGPRQRKERFLSLFAATYELAISDGITYIEPGYDSIFLDFFEMDLEKMLMAIEKQINRYKDRMTIAPDIGIIRVFDMKDIERTIYPCIESGFFKALDIFADERFGPSLEDFAPIFKAAGKKGMKLKAHAGELLDAEFVRRSVEVLELDEVQHGIAAASSKEVMAFLAQRQVQLNICPSSNIQLCQVESYKTHPLRILLDNGIKATINTDDAIIFGRTSSDEFFSLYETGLYTPGELDTLRLNGFPSSAT